MEAVDALARVRVGGVERSVGAGVVAHHVVKAHAAPFDMGVRAVAADVAAVVEQRLGGARPESRNRQHPDLEAFMLGVVPHGVSPVDPELMLWRLLRSHARQGSMAMTMTIL